LILMPNYSFKIKNWKVGKLEKSKCSDYIIEKGWK
jgi:hypothetical protein